MKKFQMFPSFYKEAYMTGKIITIAAGVVIAAAIIAGIIYVIVNPNSKSISEHFRGDDGKYE